MLIDISRCQERVREREDRCRGRERAEGDGREIHSLHRGHILKPFESWYQHELSFFDGGEGRGKGEREKEKKFEYYFVSRLKTNIGPIGWPIVRTRIDFNHQIPFPLSNNTENKGIVSMRRNRKIWSFGRISILIVGFRPPPPPAPSPRIRIYRNRGMVSRAAKRKIFSKICPTLEDGTRVRTRSKRSRCFSLVGVNKVEREF